MNKHAIITDDEYHSRPEISKSQLDLIEKDINGIEWARNCPINDKKVNTFNIGKALHSILLEPETMDKYAREPDVDRRTKDGKEELAAFRNENRHKTILSNNNFEMVNLMFSSVMAHPGARKLVEADGAPELSWFWTDEGTGVACRCRPDKTIDNTPFLLDIKTTDKLSTFKFSVEDYRYYVQEPFYCDGLAANGIDKTRMIFLVIQKTIECGRYPVGVYSLPEELVDYGRKCYKRNLTQYAERNPNEIVSVLQMHDRFMRNINVN